MVITLIRVVILYVFVTGSVRLMGKHQIGDMRPAEFVVTILLSEIAAMPIQDNDLPLVNSVVALLLIASFEIINSYAGFKSKRYRSFLQGNSLIVIREGKIDRPQLKRLRYSLDDLLEALRDKNIFDISEVEYAILETNGKLSVLPKPEYKPATARTLDIPARDTGLPCTVVQEGKIISASLADCGASEEGVTEILEKNNVLLSEVLLMTLDKSGKTNIMLKGSGERK